MLKKVTILLVVMLLVFSFCTAALAYDYISSTSLGLYINASGKATCSASISAYPGVDSVRISGYLKQLTGSGWVTIDHWTATGGTYASMSHDRYVTQGYSYKFEVYFYAYEGNDSESLSRSVYDSY